MCHPWHTSGTPLRISQTSQFIRWQNSLSASERARIYLRLERLTLGHLGDSRSLGEGLFELKWRSGLRVYYTIGKAEQSDLTVLWGGYKGTQGADIAKARRLKEIVDEHEK